jgi:hypothetical protein
MPELILVIGKSFDGAKFEKIPLRQPTSGLGD